MARSKWTSERTVMPCVLRTVRTSAVDPAVLHAGEEVVQKVVDELDNFGAAETLGNVADAVAEQRQSAEHSCRAYYYARWIARGNTQHREHVCGTLLRYKTVLALIVLSEYSKWLGPIAPLIRSHPAVRYSS